MFLTHDHQSILSLTSHTWGSDLHLQSSHNFTILYLTETFELSGLIENLPSIFFLNLLKSTALVYVGTYWDGSIPWWSSSEASETTSWCGATCSAWYFTLSSFTVSLKLKSKPGMGNKPKQLWLCSHREVTNKPFGLLPSRFPASKSLSKPLLLNGVPKNCRCYSRNLVRNAVWAPSQAQWVINRRLGPGSWSFTGLWVILMRKFEKHHNDSNLTAHRNHTGSLKLFMFMCVSQHWDF